MATGTVQTTTFESVTGYLSWDHDRLDAILKSVQGWVERGEWGHAHREYGEFDRGLDRHIRLEEQDGLASLLTVLPNHNLKEEQILYPTTDDTLLEPDRVALAARLQRE
jgi:hypothetical protein